MKNTVLNTFINSVKVYISMITKNWNLYFTSKNYKTSYTQYFITNLCSIISVYKFHFP